ncbi:MAG: 4Fe-4S dicluster domain-containing protein [Lachnospiraceae bacterium]|nr:4Fe-4S dicluster domain-containing protein [Lachnospiraceae bacterium]
MKIILKILRRKDAASEPYWISIPYETDEAEFSVASALRAINEDTERRDVNGEPFEPIRWECSCLQKKCGSCAMVIDGKPGLACDAMISGTGKERTVTLEPLKTFPPVADLIADRSSMFEELKKLKVWSPGGLKLSEEAEETAYDASRCLQCGCCLEVCPNFHAGGSFAGNAALGPFTRLLAELPKKDNKELSASYSKYVFEGCGKSLACRDVCPAGIDIDRLLVHSNAIAVWRRKSAADKVKN